MMPARRFAVGAAAAVAALLMLASLAADRGRPRDLPAHELASAGRPTRTPLASAPDPHVIRTSDRYYAFTTNGTEPGGGDLFNIQRYESLNLTDWTRTAEHDALPDRPTWATPTGAWVWAPTVFEASDGQFVMFFTARHAGSGRQCIGRAEASSPSDAFVPTGSAPVICQTTLGGSIDPYHFKDPTSGARYLYWKNDGNACSGSCPTRLYGRRLTADGDLVGPARGLLKGDQFWEIPLIEAPAMTHSPVGDTYRLFYSGNWYTTSYYSTGYGRCDGPLGPCTKITTAGPWHNNTPWAKGPGGAAFFTDFEGKNWMAYHGYDPGSIGPGHARRLFLEKIDLHASPVVNTRFPYAFHQEPPHPYVDVRSRYWADDAISWLSADSTPFPAAATSQVATGVGFDPDELFRPTASVTRGQLLNWAWRLHGEPGGSPPPTYLPNPFSDSAAWIGTALDWVSAEDLMTGYPTNADPPACGGPGPAPVFRPNCSISRGEYVRLLWRLMGEPTGYPDPGFTDLAPTSWVFDAVSWAAGEGHMTGYPDNTFRIADPVRRDQVANALHAVYGA